MEQIAFSKRVRKEVVYSKDRKNKNKISVYYVGDNPGGEYSLDRYVDDISWIACWYEIGDYCGSGDGIAYYRDNTYSIFSLSHCSCYGPFEDIPLHNRKPMTEEDVEKEITEGKLEERLVKAYRRADRVA